MTVSRKTLVAGGVVSLLCASADGFVVPGPRRGLAPASLRRASSSISSSHYWRMQDHHPTTTTREPSRGGSRVSVTRMSRQQRQRVHSNSDGRSAMALARGRASGPLCSSSRGDSGGEGKGFERGSWTSGSRSGDAVDAEFSDAGDGGDGDGGRRVSGDPATRSALKAKIFRQVATLNRGFVAQEADRVDLEEIIEMLELENPNPIPCEGFKSMSSPIAGRWQLLYTTSLDVLSLQVNPAVTVGQIFQEVEEDGLGIQNIIELQPPFAAVANRVLGSSVATLTVKLETEPVSDTRINLKFVKIEIKANSVFGRALDLPSLGVDVPSGDELQKFLAKGKSRVQNAKKRVQELAQKKKKANGGGEAADEGTEEVAGEGGDGGGLAPEETSEHGGDTAGMGDGAASSVIVDQPYFETTYVDEDLRIGRTGQGDVFVSARA